MKISSYEAMLVHSILDNVYRKEPWNCPPEVQWGFGFASEDHEALLALRQRLEDEDYGDDND
jgi:hypothetical protein